MTTEFMFLLFFVLLVFLAVAGVLFWLVPLGLFIKAVAAKIDCSPANFIGFRIRGTDPKKIILPAVKLQTSRAKLGAEQAREILSLFEAHYLAGGDLDYVVDLLIEEKEEGREMSFEEACKEDLAGSEE